MLPILYSFRRCPYAMRARLALKYAGVAVELREVTLRHKPDAMLVASAKGTVPVLQLANGEVLDESLDIMNWALAQSDLDGWIPDDDSAAISQALIATNDGPFKLWLDRYKYADRYPEQDAAAYRAEAIKSHIEPLNERLNTSPYLLGAEPTLADIAIMPFIRQFAQVDAKWFEGVSSTLGDAPFPALKDWLQQLVSTTLFTTAMGKFPAWQPGDAVTVF